MLNPLNYDLDGNVISNQMRNISAIEYDHRNLPLSITGNNGTSSYGYDDAGNRIFKTATGKKEFYLRSATGKELAIYEVYSRGEDTMRTVNLYGAGLIGRIDVRYVPYTYTDPETHDTINTIRRNDERFYYLNDHLGSVRAIVDSSGTFVFAQDTYPYGDVYRNYSLGGYSDQKYDFTGKERDVETGLHYYGARYYDSDLGVWYTVDPMNDKFPGFSPYNYCVNNPLRFVDMFGFEPDSPIKWHLDPVTGTQTTEEIKVKPRPTVDISYYPGSLIPSNARNGVTKNPLYEGVHQTGNQLLYFSKYSAYTGVGFSVLSFYPLFAPITLPAAYFFYDLSTLLGISATACKIIDAGTGYGTIKEATEVGTITALSFGLTKFVSMPSSSFVRTVGYGSGAIGLDGRFLSKQFAAAVRASKSIVDNALSEKIAEVISSPVLNSLYPNHSK